MNASRAALDNHDPLAAQQLLRMATETNSPQWIQAALNALVYPTPAQFLPNAHHPRVTRDGNYLLMIRDGQVIRQTISTGKQETLYAETNAVDLAIQANNAVVILTPDAVHLKRTSGERTSFKLTRKTDLQTLSADGSTVAVSRAGRVWRWDVLAQRAQVFNTEVEGLAALSVDAENTLRAEARDGSRWVLHEDGWVAELAPVVPASPKHTGRWQAVEDAGGIALYDTQTPASAPRFSLHASAITDIVCAPGSLRMFSAADDGTVQMTRLNDPNRPLPLSGHQPGAITISLGPDHALLATYGDRSARIWTTDKGALFRVLHHDSPVYATALNHDNSSIATAAADGLHLWSEGEPALLPVDGTVSALRFSDDGKQLRFALDGVPSQVAVPRMQRVVSAPEQAIVPVDTPYRFPGIEQQTRQVACDDTHRWLFGTQTGDVHVRTTQPAALLKHLQRAAPCMDPVRRERYLGESSTQATDRWQSCMDHTGPRPPG